MNWFSKIFQPSDKDTRLGLPVKSEVSTPADTFDIPEPTKSLLWITEEDTSKISSPLSIKINISITDDGVETNIDRSYNFFSEPSLIWTQLPLVKNNNLTDKPIYFPSYHNLSPKERYQYVNWLRDVTQPTNLSYVFLYYYGLERHLLVGNFDLAVAEILRLLKHHDKGTFRSYAQTATIVAALYRKRPEIFKDTALIFDGISNETLLMRKWLNEKIKPYEIITIASAVGFKNRRYIKSYPEEFETELKLLVNSYESKHGSLLDLVPAEDMDYEDTSVFANVSLPDKVRRIRVPKLIKDKRFHGKFRMLLEEAHNNLRRKLKDSHPSFKDKPI